MAMTTAPPKATMDCQSNDGDESRALLQPQDDGLSGKRGKPVRKVQWMDRNGDNKLAEILEFQPSEAGDSDEDESDSCICRIM